MGPDLRQLLNLSIILLLDPFVRGVQELRFNKLPRLHELRCRDPRPNTGQPIERRLTMLDVGASVQGAIAFVEIGSYR